MKIKFNTDDNLPFNKPLKLYLLKIIVWCLFEEGSKFRRLFVWVKCLRKTSRKQLVNARIRQNWLGGIDLIK